MLPYARSQPSDLLLNGIQLILRLPIDYMAYGIFFLGLAVLGPVIYLTGESQFQWPFQLLILGLFTILSVSRLRYARSVPVFYWFIGIFIFIALASSVINVINPLQFAVTSRWYFFFWPAVFALGLGVLKSEEIITIWKLLLFVVLLQLPMALYQMLFVMPGVSVAPWDVVVGTFPGQKDGGGQSAAMGLFLVTMMLLAFALYRANLLRLRWVALFSVVIVSTLACMEVKAALLMIPVAFGTYFWKEALRKPLAALAAGFLVILAILIISSQYQDMYESRESTVDSEYDNLVVAMMMRAVDPEQETHGGERLGRITILVMWNELHPVDTEFIQTLLGYGLGATQRTNLVEGEIAKRFSFPVDITSTSLLLWEVGVLGYVAFILIFLAGAVTSFRLAKHKAVDPWSSVVLRVGAIFLLLIMFTTPYRDFALRSLPIWLLTILCLGQAAYWHGRLKHAS